MNPVTSCAALRCLPRSKEAGQIFVFVDNIWTHTDTPGEKPKKKKNISPLSDPVQQKGSRRKKQLEIFFFGNAVATP
jgi:hypothetical protein